MGLLVMDEVEKTEDRRFAQRLHDYFVKTVPGRERSRWIVPSPFFVASDMALPVQAADVVIYALNWGYRHAAEMTAPTRPEIENRFCSQIEKLKWKGEGYDGVRTYKSFGIVCARPLHTPEIKKETTLLNPPHSLRAKVIRSRISVAIKPHSGFVGKSLFYHFPSQSGHSYSGDHVFESSRAAALAALAFNTGSQNLLCRSHGMGGRINGPTDDQPVCAGFDGFAGAEGALLVVGLGVGATDSWRDQLNLGWEDFSQRDNFQGGTDQAAQPGANPQRRKSLHLPGGLGLQASLG